MTTLGTQPETPNELIGVRVIEPLVRQFLAYQFDQISRTIDDPEYLFIEELFQSYGNDIVRQIKEWWRQYSNIPVTLNYPRQDISIPFVSVVNGSEEEIEDRTYLGDHGGQAQYGVLGAAIPTGEIPRYTRELISIPQRNRTVVFIAANDPNALIYLHYVTKALLVVNKLDFLKYADMHNLVLSSTDLEYRSELFPEFAYFKTITLTYDTSFDVPTEKESTIIGGVNIGLQHALKVSKVSLDLEIEETIVRPFED